MENHALQKTKRGDRYRIAMGPRALTASSGLTPWSMAVDHTSAALEKKSNPFMGVKRACLLGLPPPLGERGSHPFNFHASSKNARGFR